MKSDRPKQFIELVGEPIILRTIKAFLRFNPTIKVIICVHKNYRNYLESLLEKSGLNGPQIEITLGGETRFASVKNGLQLITDLNAVVGIHDAARPFVSQQTISTCYEVAAQKGSAIPCISVHESMRKISNNVNNSVNRHEYKIIQTPQCFITGPIKKAFERSYSTSFTDDATVFEASGENVFLVEGNEENIKITSPHDLLIATAIAKQNHLA